MWLGKGRGIGWLCISPSVLKGIALGMIAAGLLLLLLFVPARYWLALLGILLILAGTAIYYLL